MKKAPTAESKDDKLAKRPQKTTGQNRDLDPVPDEKPTGKTAEVSTGARPPPVSRSAYAIQCLPDKELRQKSLATLQQLYGNAYATQVADRVSGVDIQRWKPGQTGSGGQTITKPTGPLSAGGGVTPTKPTQGVPATGAGPASPKGKPTAATGPAPPPVVKLPVQTAAVAQDAINRTFGQVARRRLVSGQLHVLRDQTATLDQYDLVSIRNGVVNPDTGQAWKKGDAYKYFLRRGGGLNGFADGNDVYVCATTAEPTVTIHEILHVNTAPTFRATAGDAINEGTTQRFATRALRESGHSTANVGNVYPRERDIVNRLVKIVSERVLEIAYFNTPQLLVNTYDSLMGPRAFMILKRTLKGTDAGFQAAQRLLQPPSIQTRVRLANALLDWWVSDADLDHFERIWNSSDVATQAAIRESVTPRVNSLTSLRQRFRLMRILASG